jgi:ribosomal protein L11 methyltransferase
MKYPKLRWLEVGIRTPVTDNEASILVDILVQMCGRGVLERDGWLYTYFEEPDELSGFIEFLRSRISSAIGNEEIHLVTRWQANEDWSEKWKRGLGPKRITDTIVVCPSWVQFHPEPDDIVIVIDPGMAFGTAEHGTTRGSLRLLASALQVDDRILDVGSGSGILAIAAAALGASEAIAIEGDSASFEALQKNAERNAVSSRINCVEEWADTHSLQAMGPVDGIVANIETNVLRPFLPIFRNALIEGGWLVLSGILSMEWPRFLENTRAEGFRCVEVDRDGEWTSGLFRSV